MKRYVYRLAVLTLVAVLLAGQSVAPLARAQEDGSATFVVAGVAGATLRAEPNGASAALAVVPADASVTMVGPDVVNSGVVWRHVRTADNAVGYVPAGLLIQNSGAPVQATSSASAPNAAVSPANAVPAGSVGAVGAGQNQADATAPTAPGISSQPAASAPVGGSGDNAGGNPVSTAAGASSSDGSRSAAAARGDEPAPSATPQANARRTTVERRRDQNVTIRHLDTERAPDGREMGAGRIVVKFKAGANQTARTDAHRVAGARSTQALRVPDTAVVDVQTGTVDQALAAYRGRSDVLWAEPNYIRRATVTPSDPDFTPQQWNLQKIGAQAAWDLTTGASSAKIAILDCGIWTKSSGVSFTDGQKGHQDLREKINTVTDEKNFSTALDADDWCDHGSLMAGIAGAQTNNSIGMAGLAFNASLMNVKVLGDNGEGEISWLANGIVWAADNGAAVISMSLGGVGACSLTEQAAIDYAWGKGVVIVAAAGNGGADGIGDPIPEAPGNCNHVIAVGAIDKYDARASFSNYNVNPALGATVPIAAPGVAVYSTTSYRPFYTTVDGTSPATPHVAAVAALAKALYPNESNQAIVNRIINSADPIVDTGTYWVNGRLNAPAALAGSNCSPRPNILVTGNIVSGALQVQLHATGLGNAIRYFQVSGAAGAMVNANLILPSIYVGGSNIPALQWGNASTYVPAAALNKVSMQITRQTPGSQAMVPMKVQDVCGTWTTFAGGGTGAGF